MRNRYYSEVFGINNQYDIDRIGHNYLEGLFWDYFIIIILGVFLGICYIDIIIHLQMMIFIYI